MTQKQYTIDLEGYRAWYEQYAKAGVFLFDETPVYIEGKSYFSPVWREEVAHVHQVTGYIGAFAFPIRFLTEITTE